MKLTELQRTMLEDLAKECQRDCDKWIKKVRREKIWQRVVTIWIAAMNLALAAHSFYLLNYWNALLHAGAALLVPTLLWKASDHAIKKAREAKRMFAQLKLSIEEALKNDDTAY